MSFRIAFLVIAFFLSCKNESESESEWEALELKRFDPRFIEREDANTIYISKSHQSNPSLRISWNSLKFTGNVKSLSLYNLNVDGSSTAFYTITDLKLNSFLLEDKINYETEYKLFLRVKDNENNESPANKSNIVSFKLTYGEPDNFTLIKNNDSIAYISLKWNFAANGSSNPIININQPRYNLFDSISVNIKYAQNIIQDYFKIISFFGSSRTIGQEFGQISESREYRIYADSLRSMPLLNNSRIIGDFNSAFFEGSNTTQLLFKKSGLYLIYVYLYKRSSNTLHVYKIEKFIEYSNL